MKTRKKCTMWSVRILCYTYKVTFTETSIDDNITVPNIIIVILIIHIMCPVILTCGLSICIEVDSSQWGFLSPRQLHRPATTWNDEQVNKKCERFLKNVSFVNRMLLTWSLIRLLMRPKWPSWFLPLNLQWLLLKQKGQPNLREGLLRGSTIWSRPGRLKVGQGLVL